MATMPMPNMADINMLTFSLFGTSSLFIGTSCVCLVGWQVFTWTWRVKFPFSCRDNFAWNNANTKQNKLLKLFCTISRMFVSISAAIEIFSFSFFSVFSFTKLSLSAIFGKIFLIRDKAIHWHDFIIHPLICMNFRHMWPMTETCK